MGIISQSCLIVVAHFTRVLNSFICSISWRAPLPFKIVAAAPPSKISGDWAICAFFIAVIVLVTPGPAVTAATPGIPVSLDMASAANTAVGSCLTSITRIPCFLAPTNIGDMCPPHKVKRKRTPCFFKT